MLDGLEGLAEAGEMGVNKDILMEATEIITAVVLARNLKRERFHSRWMERRNSSSRRMETYQEGLEEQLE